MSTKHGVIQGHNVIAEDVFEATKLAAAAGYSRQDGSNGRRASL